MGYICDILGGIEHGYLYNIQNKLSIITKKNYDYNFCNTNTPHTDGYNLKLDHKEFDRKIHFVLGGSTISKKITGVSDD